MSCCGCCSALRPRYKRLVDNIFPVNPDDGLVKSNMEKLTFYSLSSPEKLDRIGEYLYQKAAKDIHRKRYKLVEIAMEAMDLLLMACHAQTLNLFVESFLRMVQKLMEDANPNLQILATNSFVRFANIEEDTPSYHRRYDFFISKFSSMCHGNHENVELRDSIRMAGIKGLQGVIRKTVSDDLVENIWDKHHMEKIVPSLLFNMQNMSSTPITSTEDSTVATPPVLAESVLRELVSRASFTHIKSVLKPLLMHLDRHELWVPNQFAIQTFRIVMISIQPQYSYTVVETLMQHLDQNMKSSPRTKTSLAVVLSKIIAIAAGESVGPSALDIINNLLTHLRTSTLSTQSEPTLEESQYQEALINALGEFANHHPDYQKIEIMLFIMNTVPDLTKTSKADQMLQTILLKSLLKVGVQYHTISFEKAFPSSFLQPLLRMARAQHLPTRLIVMKIFQALLDRHQNQVTLSVIKTKNYVDLSLETPSRSDIIFTHKHGANIMQALLDTLLIDMNTEALIATFNTAALMVVEMCSGETIQEFLLFILGIQQLAATTQELSETHRCNLHIISIALFSLVCRVTGINSLTEYSDKIIADRAIEATHFLPPLIETSGKFNLNIPQVMMDKITLAECLQSAGIESGRLQSGVPYSLNSGDQMGPRQSWVDPSNVHAVAMSMSRASNGDIQSFNDNDSVNSSPGVQRRVLTTEFNFDAMKRVLGEPTEAIKRENSETQRQLVKTFRNANFEDLMRRTEPKHDVIQTRLSDLFNSLAVERQIIGQTDQFKTSQSNKSVYENNFPELFFY
ncbi:protein EFR3 homolog cmp44E isoform X2 [Sitodiplosis mosellana]|uniref:protein EFR3 homolog cmp44E isoform X2 n=1 Tax=Sitodiplosis mosellana TaxID=263140 RepID=UPI002443B6E2|nr:protein EFR3 homolog cmp44E isoform X2 [Sitodiplosis mosellana]